MPDPARAPSAEGGEGSGRESGQSVGRGPRAARVAARLGLSAALLCQSAVAAGAAPPPGAPAVSRPAAAPSAVSPPAEPPEPPEPPAERAAQRFDEGISALKAGDFDVACPALEQSHALEASLGTLLALADCLERWQKPASASARYAEFVDALARAGDAETRYRAEQLAFARAALERLEPLVPRLRLVRGAPWPGEASVLLDGRALSLSELERERSLDPGPHVLETRAPGHQPRRVALELAAGERLSWELELGPPLPATPPSTPAPTRPRAEPDAPRAPRGLEREPSSSVWRTVGWSLGGLGVAAVGAGAVAGAMLLETCPGLDCAAREARGKRLALITDVGLGVGAVALISSVLILVNTDPAASPQSGLAGFSPVGVVHPRGGWLGMSRSF